MHDRNFIGSHTLCGGTTVVTSERRHTCRREIIRNGNSALLGVAPCTPINCAKCLFAQSLLGIGK